MKDLKKLLDLLPEKALDRLVEKVEQEQKELKELIDLFGELTPECRLEKIQQMKMILKTHLKFGNVDNDCYCKLKQEIHKNEEQ